MSANIGLYICSGIIAAVGFLAIYFTYKKDEEDKAQIEATTALLIQTTTATEKIKELNRVIDFNLATNLSITKEVKEFQKLHGELLVELEQLGYKNHKLSKKIDQNIEIEKGRRSLSDYIGSKDSYVWNSDPATFYKDYFEFYFGAYHQKTDAWLILGGDSFWSLYSSHRRNDPFTLSAVDRQIVFSYRAKDVHGQEVLKIIDNIWTLRDGLFYRYNYDENGFELLDEEENVLFSYDIIDSRTIKIQGYRYLDQNKVEILGRYQNMLVEREDGKDFLKEIGKKQLMCNVSRIFEYSGKNWFHNRTKTTEAKTFGENIFLCGRNLDVVFKYLSADTYRVGIYRDEIEIGPQGIHLNPFKMHKSEDGWSGYGGDYCVTEAIPQLGKLIDEFAAGKVKSLKQYGEFDSWR
jgi:hypothetical protein